MKKNYALADLTRIAEEIIANSKHKKLLFYGSMGVGKTTLIKEIVTCLGANDRVSSPTFSLVNEYMINEKEMVYHFDFYRIDNEEEALDIGVEEYFYSNSWCLVEWPNKVENLLPLKSVSIILTHSENQQRTIELINNE